MRPHLSFIPSPKNASFYVVPDFSCSFFATTIGCSINNQKNKIWYKLIQELEIFLVFFQTQYSKFYYNKIS